MPQYDNELKFALFENNKEGNDKRPDWRGEITVNGVKYTLSGWVARSEKAGAYIRGSAQIATEKKPGGGFRPKQENTSMPRGDTETTTAWNTPPRAEPPKPTTQEDADQDCPF